MGSKRNSSPTTATQITTTPVVARTSSGECVPKVDSSVDSLITTTTMSTTAVSPVKEQQPVDMSITVSQQEQQVSDGNHNTITTVTTKKRQQVLRRTASLSEVSWHATSGILASAAVLVFSIYFPFWLAPWAAKQTYHPAAYHYKTGLSYFDNTAWTYGTDYFLAVCMLLLAAAISVSHPVSRHLALFSRSLLACYGASVLAGGLAHQFFITLEDRNTWQFRVLWSVCVGTVCLASIFMGCIGTELVRRDHHQGEYGLAYKSLLPIIPEGFWIAYGCITIAVCLHGGMSFQRPACDLFVAGITQFPSTFYMMTVLAVALPTHPLLPTNTRTAGVVGFILNAPLLPLYPLLIQYTHWTLGTVNTFLHTWLLIAWTLQGWVLRRVERSLVCQATPPSAAVPLKQQQSRL